MNKYLNKLKFLSVPVILVVFSLGCKESSNTFTSSSTTPMSTSLLASEYYIEGETANPESSVGADVILAKDYRVESFTENMTDGPRITVDGRLYYYPRSKVPCGRDLTIVGEDGGMAILRLSCIGSGAVSSVSANLGSLSEGSVSGNVIIARDYEVESFTEDMTDGPRITVDGRLYYYPRSKVPCGKDLTIVGEDGGRGVLRISCY